MFQIGLKKFLWLRKLKILFCDFNGEEIVGMFSKKNYKKQKELRVEKLIKRKEDKLYVKWKCYDNCNGVVLEIYLNHKFQWLQESLNSESLTHEVVT